MRYIFVVVIVMFFMPFLLSCNTNDNEEHLSFTTLNTEGLQSELVPSQELVISDQESLNEFWASYGSDAEPHLDFDAYVVVGVFIGVRPNPGYSVEVVDVIRSADKTSVLYVEDLPNPDGSYPAVESYPYDMVFFEKVDGHIDFSSSQETRLD